MGVSTWLAIVACVFVIQESAGFERQRITAIAKMVGRRLAKKQNRVVPSVNPTMWTPSPTSYPTHNPTVYPTHNPTVNPTHNPTVNPTHNPTVNPTHNPTVNPSTPHPINFYQHWVDCPVMESILEEYFHGFPNILMPKDNMHISPDEVGHVLNRSMSAFDYLKNVRVALDLMVGDMAHLVLDKRVNCTSTMYQRVFVYYMRKRLDTMMASHDSSLKSRIEQLLHRYFPNKPEILGMATELVWGVHYVIHESFIEILMEEEFKSLGWFLRGYRWKMTSFMERYHRGEFTTINDVILMMQNDFFNTEMTMYPDAFRCTSPKKFIQMHRRAANWTATYYWQAQKSGLAVAFLTNHLQEAFSKNPSTATLDPMVIDDVIQKITHVIFQYINNTMGELARYEGYLASATLSPPTFMANNLTGPQWNMTMVLFNRMFGNSPTQFPPVNPSNESKRRSQQLVRPVKDSA
ncbi:uncharacterized protein LOC117322464 isoform X2 [Pecten maximus]|uniref:uncharacterized protein LOC117322464 isoform X2 n=1 Tax=Pecten maximus TaxID=6579 RepID=UPI0014581518|nr:uncharacterized protein LOC117322464 isoform X2 [Pecten maximus]